MVVLQHGFCSMTFEFVPKNICSISSRDCVGLENKVLQQNLKGSKIETAGEKLTKFHTTHPVIATLKSQAYASCMTCCPILLKPYLPRISSIDSRKKENCNIALLTQIR